MQALNKAPSSTFRLFHPTIRVPVYYGPRNDSLLLLLVSLGGLLLCNFLLAFFYAQNCLLLKHNKLPEEVGGSLYAASNALNTFGKCVTDNLHMAYGASSSRVIVVVGLATWLTVFCAVSLILKVHFEQNERVIPDGFKLVPVKNQGQRLQQPRAATAAMAIAATFEGTGTNELGQAIINAVTNEEQHQQRKENDNNHLMMVRLPSRDGLGHSCNSLALAIHHRHDDSFKKV